MYISCPGGSVVPALGPSPQPRATRHMDLPCAGSREPQVPDLGNVSAGIALARASSVEVVADCGHQNGMSKPMTEHRLTREEILQSIELFLRRETESDS